ncbi:hypothetical protein TWF718_008277, partial [Orbilia javanica]
PLVLKFLFLEEGRREKNKIKHSFITSSSFHHNKIHSRFSPFPLEIQSLHDPGKASKIRANFLVPAFTHKKPAVLPVPLPSYVQSSCDSCLQTITGPVTYENPLSLPKPILSIYQELRSPKVLFLSFIFIWFESFTRPY